MQKIGSACNEIIYLGLLCDFFSDEKPESDFPKVQVIDILESLLPFVSIDVCGMSKKAETSLGFYKTCLNMVEGADESLKNAFRFTSHFIFYTGRIQIQCGSNSERSKTKSI